MLPRAREHLTDIVAQASVASRMQLILGQPAGGGSEAAQPDGRTLRVASRQPVDRSW